MRIELNSISDADIEALPVFLNALKAKGFNPSDDLYKTIESIYLQLNQAKQLKINLLRLTYAKMQPIDLNDPKQKMRFYVICQQILCNHLMRH